jgi:hypothetical protein
MVKDQRWQIYSNIVQCLTLILVRMALQMPFEQEIDDNTKQWPNSFERGHGDVGYEHMFVNIVPYDDLHFNDMLTQSFDNQPRTITQSY